MTAPEQPPPQQGPTATQTTIVVAAVGLALLAIEARVRDDITTAIAAAVGVWASLVTTVITAGQLRSGTELLSRNDVHTTLVRSLASARTSVAGSIRSGHTAAGALAWARARRDLRDVGHDLPDTMPELPDTPDALIDDMATAFGDAQTDAQNSVRDAFDGVFGDDPTSARTVVVHQAITRFANRLTGRANAAGAVAVHQGATDAQLAAYAHLATVNPYITLRKRWVVTAVDPCDMCAALHNTSIAIDAEFDHAATTGVLRPVWGDLQAPPRHPGCRCQLELHVEHPKR